MTRRYSLLIEPDAHEQRKQLPGHVRQRVKQVIDALIQNPRPHNSQALDTTELDIPEGVEIRRVRIDRWRVIYAVNDKEEWIWVWGVRKRPPYSYEDLVELAEFI
jgi:mRNA-degrading endonuclease RelE of RelBE toxin-antitoxin system